MKYLFFLFSILVTLSLSIQSNAQKTFDSKRHKDTSTTKPLIYNSINGANSQTPSLLFGNKSGFPSPYIQSKIQNQLDVNIVRSVKTELPVFISSNHRNKNSRLELRSNKNEACFQYLNELKNLTGIANPEQDLIVKSSEQEKNGKTHFRMVQKYNSVKIYGSEVIVHLNSSGQGESFNGNYHKINKNINTTPKIDKKLALNAVFEDVSKNTILRDLNEAERTLLKYAGPLFDTVIYQELLSEKYLLAYHISLYPNLLEHWDYFVDAQNGNVIHSIKNSCHIDGPKNATSNDLSGANRAISTYQIGNLYYLLDASRQMFNAVASFLPNDPIGAVVTLDLKNSYGSNTTFSQITNSTNIWNNPNAVSAHFNAGMAYEYYAQTFQRNSIDGKGGTIISLINAVDNDGSALDNAYWNGEAMFYGNGKTNFKPLAGSMDVAGHEMTHGVVQSTANLRYEGESGAINESMADIFGCMMDSTDWLIGEDVVFASSFPSGALRSLSDPHNGGFSLNDESFQPKHMSEKYRGSEDNFGVHINSGIPNYAFYKLATALGSRRNASKIFYRALTIFLTASSQFSDLRLATIQSAKDLFGDNSYEAIQTGIAFDAVGITNTTKVEYTVTLPTNPGNEYLLVNNTDPASSNGLYRTTPGAGNLTPLTSKILDRKPSITDNGEMGYFVGTDKKIYQFKANPLERSTPSIFHNSAIWENVGISKDGKRLAAVTLGKDTSIYVFDLLRRDVTARFKLYNPTYSENVKSVGPVYADALEWTYDGESVIYDCFNELKSASGNHIEYWDINKIKVWDNSKNDFANGEILKLFNNLSEGENLGNPVISKKSPNIIAFDYIDYINQTAAVVGLDLEANDIGLIAENNTLGFPSFNKTDTRVAFTTLNNFNEPEVSYVNLSLDKISSYERPITLFTEAQWPVYYAVGSRNLNVGIEEEEVSEVKDIIIYPNPTDNLIHIKLNTTKGTLEVFNQLGTKLISKEVSGNEMILDLTDFPKGVYSLISRSEDSKVVIKKIVKK